MELPIDYNKATYLERKNARDQYVTEQDGKCAHCGGSLSEPPPAHITEKLICWKLFPPNFLKYPVHLQHNHQSGITIGAVHAYCNAVLWQYEGE